MPKKDKKQRHKAKRAAKRKEIRRRDSVSPFKRLAEAPGDVECWMSDRFDELGQAHIYIYKRAAGLSGISCFLIDRGVVGLKDCWSRMKIDRQEFEAMRKLGSEKGIESVRASLEQVKDIVAGGMRWAHENGMRLPKDWAKCAILLGGVGDWASADVSRFEKRFAGHPEDLRQRLIGEPFETYIRREDIEFIFSDSAAFKDQRTGRYLNNEFEEDSEDSEAMKLLREAPAEKLNEMAAKFDAVSVKFAEQTSNWLDAQGETSSSELPQAWRTLILAMILAKGTMPNAAPKQIAKVHEELILELGRRVDDDRVDEYEVAIEEALSYLETNPAAIADGLMSDESAVAIATSAALMPLGSPVD